MVLGHNHELMMVSVRFKRGGIGAPHNHPHRQVSYIAKGRFDVTIGGVVRTLSEGDSFFVPADVIHGVVALEEGINIDVFHPMREDFVHTAR
jgi:quercetin dioxygenase-like cupin family protein